MIFCAVTGVTAIFLASNFGHGTALEVLIEAGGDVNLTSTQNTSPLLVATVGGHTAVVEILLENDADISIVAKTGDTAVLRAVQFDPKVEKAKANHVEIFKLLLEAGADPDTKKAPDGQSLIWIATFNGDTEVVKLLLADGVDLDRYISILNSLQPCASAFFSSFSTQYLTNTPLIHAL